MQFPGSTAPLLSCAVALIGCNAIFEIEDLRFDDAATTSAGATTGGGGHGDGGSAGGVALGGMGGEGGGTLLQNNCGRTGIYRDDFELGKLGSKWLVDAPGGGLALTNGQVVASPSDGARSWLFGRYTVDGTEATTQVEIVSNNFASAQANAVLSYGHDSANFIQFGFTVDDLFMLTSVDANALVTLIAKHDAQQHRFLRIVERNGLLTFQTSPDGAIWTDQATFNTPAFIDNVSVGVGIFDGPGGSLTFDNIDTTFASQWCPSASLVDDFDDSDIGREWLQGTGEGCALTHATGRAWLELDDPTAASCLYASSKAFDAGDSSVSVNVPAIANSVPSLRVYLRLVDARDQAIEMGFHGGNAIYAQVGSGLLSTFSDEIPYDGDESWRIRLSGSTVWFELHDGSAWSPFAQTELPPDFDVSQMQIQLGASANEATSGLTIGFEEIKPVMMPTMRAPALLWAIFVIVVGCGIDTGEFNENGNAGASSPGSGGSGGSSMSMTNGSAGAGNTANGGAGNTPTAAGGNGGAGAAGGNGGAGGAGGDPGCNPPCMGDDICVDDSCVHICEVACDKLVDCINTSCGQAITNTQQCFDQCVLDPTAYNAQGSSTRSAVRSTTRCARRTARSRSRVSAAPQRRDHNAGASCVSSGQCHGEQSLSHGRVHSRQRRLAQRLLHSAGLHQQRGVWHRQLVFADRHGRQHRVLPRLLATSTRGLPARLSVSVSHRTGLGLLAQLIAMSREAMSRDAKSQQIGLARAIGCRWRSAGLAFARFGRGRRGATGLARLNCDEP